MVLSKSTKDRNKTLMVLKFAYGMKNHQRAAKKLESSCTGNAYKPQEKSELVKKNSDKSLCNGKQPPLNDHITDQKVQIIQHSNRTCRSMTHASSEVDSAKDTLISLDDFCDRSVDCAKTTPVEYKPVAGGGILHVSPFGFSKDADEAENGTSLCEAIDRDDALKLDSEARGEVKGDAIEDIIKEIESVSLTSSPQDKVVANGGTICNGKSRDKSVKETASVASFMTQDIESPPKAISPFLSRLSTESRISNATSESLVSNCSRSSQKSLAEKIIERRADLQLSTFDQDRICDDHSVDMPPVAGSSCGADSQCSIETEQYNIDASGENYSTKKTKHAPDLIPLEGENSRQIIRRRRVRKILTAE